jgi:hypothetical protein
MATADRNGVETTAEVEQAKNIALRYRSEFVDLDRKSVV